MMGAMRDKFRYLVKKLKTGTKEYERYISIDGRESFTRQEASQHIQSLAEDTRPLLQTVTNDKCHHDTPLTEDCGECQYERMQEVEGRE